MSKVEVVGLSYYPIKSCGAVEADSIGFSEFGIEYDREWILVGSNGQALTQRNHPELSLVKVGIDGDSLVVNARGVGELTVSLERDEDAEPVPVNLWKKPGTGTNEQEASKYFSEYLGKDARLLRIQQPREVKPECRVEGASERTAFADSFPLLLTSANSLADLNQYLEPEITIDRFRPNVVVEGAPAYEEDYWRKVRIGNLTAFVVRACARCPVPNVEQQVGVLPLPKDRHVTQALREKRQGLDLVGGKKGEFFGQNLVHVFEPGVVVRIRDTVSVEEKAEEPNFRQAS